MVFRFTLRTSPEEGILIFIVFPELWNEVQRHSSTVTSSPLVATNWSEKDGCICTSSKSLLAWIIMVVFGLCKNIHSKSKGSDKKKSPDYAQKSPPASPCGRRRRRKFFVLSEFSIESIQNSVSQ
jgi:hypothetical protein